MPQVKQVSINNLYLDENNPRISACGDQLSCMLQLYECKPNSYVQLMKSMSENGFLQGENILLSPHPTKRGKFIVREGNRRISAIKLLHGERKWLSSGKIPKPLLNLVKKFPAEIASETEKVPCSIYFPDEEPRLRKEIAVRHAYDEAGREEWPSVRKSQNLRDETGVTPLELELLERYFCLHEGTEQAWAPTFSLTVLKDFLKHMAVHFGYESAEQMVKVYPDSATQAQVDKMLEMIYQPADYSGITKLENRRIDNLAAEFLSKYLEKPTTTLAKEHKPTPVVSRQVVQQVSTTAAARTKEKKAKAVSPVEEYAKSISDLCIRVANPKLQQLAKENRTLIKSAVKLPYAQTLVLRTLLDCSLQELCSLHNERPNAKQPMLGHYLERALDKKLITDPQTVAVLEKARHEQVKSLHTFIHTGFLTPAKEDIESNYNNLLPIILSILQDVLAKQESKKEAARRREQAAGDATAP